MASRAAHAAAERFTRLWVEAQPAVSAYLASLAPDFRDAQDLLQEVAVVALRKFETFDDSRSFAGWCLGIARFEALRHRRRFARSPWLMDDSLCADLAAACEELHSELDTRSRHLTECIQALDDDAARMIRLRYHEGLKPGAVAERLGRNPGAVRVALSRIRAALRECVERKLEPT